MVLNHLKGKGLFFVLLTVTALFFFYTCFNTIATFDSGDGVRHYLMARYSWEHPYLLLDLWAKTLFTLLASPFARFGMIGMNVFQIICFVFTSYLCYRIATRLEIKNVFIIPVLIGFAPIYFPLINSGLTELFFALMIVTAIFFTIEKKYLIAAVVISFLPFARNEGYMFFPLFGLVFLYRKQYLPIFLFLFGTLLLSVIGLISLKDFFWLFHRNPYQGAGDIYGHGELLSFVKQYDDIFGLPMTIFICIGMAGICFKLIFLKRSLSTFPLFTEEVLLVYGCAIAYFVAHSIFWWKGIFSSLGLLRMMAAIIPLTALITLRGFNLILDLVGKFRFMKYISILLLVIFQLRLPFHQWYFPFHLGGEEEVIGAAGNWIKDRELTDKKIYYLHPYLPFILDKDPFNSQQAVEIWNINKENPVQDFTEGSLVVWDAHYVPNEGGIALSKLQTPYLRLLQKFIPQASFTVIGGREFQVFIFQKGPAQYISSQNNFDSQEPLLQEERDTIDFENSDIVINKNTLVTDRSFSGKHSSKLSNLVEYSAGVERVGIFYNNNKNNIINTVVVQLKVASDNPIKNALLVIEVYDTAKKQVLWQAHPINIESTDGHQWKSFTTTYSICPQLLTSGNSFKCYIWNTSKETFYIDDMIFSYIYDPYLSIPCK